MNRRRILQVDAGNSGAKWRLVCAGEVLQRGTIAVDAAGPEAGIGEEIDGVDEVWVASVLAPEEDRALLSRLDSLTPKRFRRAVSVARCAGVTNSYTEPETLGVDRWLALLAARRRCADRACVVDAGTALTIDFLGADGRHEGGYIVPGPALMESALFSGTGRVRAVDADVWNLAPGTTTAAAVRAGISAALAGALMAALDGDHRSRQPAPQLLVTGGYGRDLLAASDRVGDFVPDLVFEGLEIAMEQGVEADSGQ